MLQTLELSKIEILDYLVELEEHICINEYVLYKPSIKNTDIIDIQKEAKNIMCFLGLDEYTPIVTFVNTNRNVGGNIELNCNADKNVFINISLDYRENLEQVLTVLAHEICHKLLFTHGLYYQEDTLHNEILTDLATIYTGLGYLTLNGCCKVLNENTSSYYRTLHEIGYLTIEHFATAYYFVCKRYGIDIMSALGASKNTYASDAIREAWILSNEDKTCLSNSEKKEIIETLQEEDAKLIKYITILEDILSQTRELIRERHLTYKSALTDAFKNEESKTPNMKDLRISYLHRLPREHSSVINKTTKRIKDIDNLLLENKEINTLRALNSVLNIRCPICGYQKEGILKDHKRTYLKCPSCKYTFLWDAESAIPMTSTSGISNNGVYEDNSNTSIKSKLKKLFS